MSAPATDSHQHFTEVRSLLLAPLNQQVYELGQVPGRKNPQGEVNEGTTPDIYVLLVVERRFAEPNRLSARASRSGWRVTTISVGRTPGEVRWAQLRVSRAFEGARLLVEGYRSSPLLPETPGAPQPDDGVISAQDTYTYSC